MASTSKSVQAIYEKAMERATREVTKKFPVNKVAKNVEDGFMKLSETVRKRFLANDPSRRCRFELFQGFPQLKREFYFWRKVIMRLMKERPTLKNPYLLSFKRDVHPELFYLIKTFLEGHLSEVEAKDTKAVKKLQINSQEDLEMLFSELDSGTGVKRRREEDKGLEKQFSSGSYSSVTCNGKKPFKMKYSLSRGVLFISCHFTVWNVDGVPQSS